MKTYASSIRPLRRRHAALLLPLLLAPAATSAESASRPNILWLVCEDISPYLGAYGHKDAHTPNLDRLAAEGVLFTQAWATAPVCAVARSSILTGMHSPVLGTHNMRSRPQLPEGIPAYPALFRAAGYYATNNAKTDYNSSFERDRTLWDESSNRAHYRNRAAGQPFLAVFNDNQSHESQLDRLPDSLTTRVNPADIELPPFHPDLPGMREAWARLHELITRVDERVGFLLQELEEEGLAKDTIVFFYSDHGGMLAGTKRYLTQPGTQVPLIVYLPEKWQHLSPYPPGSVVDRVVSFVDLPATILSLAGIEPPELMHGRAFLGPHAEPAPARIPLYRDRMSERYDMSRGLLDGQYLFVRNFMPHRPPGRDTIYGYTVQANWRAWRDHFEAGLTNEVQSRFFQPKPLVELYNVREDPWNVHNLAALSAHAARVREFEAALDRWMIENRDLGLLPEPLYYELIGPGKDHTTLYEYARGGDFPVERLLAAARLASEARPGSSRDLLRLLADDHPAVRHWAAYGLYLMQEPDARVRRRLRAMMQNDPFAGNRIMAAQALALNGDPAAAFDTILREARSTEIGYVFLFALNAFQFSRTDDRLTRQDWESFAARSPAIPYDMASSFAQRIVSNALDLWPERVVLE